MTYLGCRQVASSLAQDHGVTDSTVRQVWEEEGEEVRVRVTTTNIRVKRVGSGDNLWELPLFRVSYCGTDRTQHKAFSFVAKANDGE